MQMNSSKPGGLRQWPLRAVLLAGTGVFAADGVLRADVGLIDLASKGQV
jgi:TRAP-type mannitol/chloroaromatic compound transport system permease small subunit